MIGAKVQPTPWRSESATAAVRVGLITEVKFSGLITPKVLLAFADAFAPVVADQQSPTILFRYEGAFLLGLTCKPLNALLRCLVRHIEIGSTGSAHILNVCRTGDAPVFQRFKSKALERSYFRAFVFTFDDLEAARGRAEMGAAIFAPERVGYAARPWDFEQPTPAPTPTKRGRKLSEPQSGLRGAAAQ